MAKTILGLDPGIADTGYGVISVEGAKLTCLAYGSIKTKAGSELAARLCRLQQSLDELVKQYRPDVVGMEQLFFNKNVTSAMAVGQARGVLLLTLKQNGLTVQDFTPGQVKQAVCAYGQATKRQVQNMVKLTLKLKQIPKPDDAADALAVALAAVNTHLWQKK